MSDSSLSPHLLPAGDRGHSTDVPSVEPHTAMTLKSMMFVSDRDRNICLDREQPGASLTKEEEEEICISPEGKQLALKQEPDASLLIPTSQGRDHLLLSHLSDEEKQDQKQTSVGEGAEAESMERLHKNGIHSCNVAHSSNFLAFHTYSLPLSESFECQMCGKDFRSECRLNEHMIIHTQVKPFRCDTCGKSFGNSWSLSARGRLHSGEKPHSCKTCGDDFPFGSALNGHVRIHTCDKPNLCHLSGKSFCQKTELMHHTRVHTSERPYLCKTCGRNFKRSTSLKSHMRRRASEKPFSCQRCGKKFRARSCLTTHMRKIHTGEKPYRCELRVEKFIRPHADS